MSSWPPNSASEVWWEEEASMPDPTLMLPQMAAATHGTTSISQSSLTLNSQSEDLPATNAPGPSTPPPISSNNSSLTSSPQLSSSSSLPSVVLQKLISAASALQTSFSPPQLISPYRKIGEETTKKGTPINSLSNEVLLFIIEQIRNGSREARSQLNLHDGATFKHKKNIHSLGPLRCTSWKFHNLVTTVYFESIELTEAWKHYVENDDEQAPPFLKTFKNFDHTRHIRFGHGISGTRGDMAFRQTLLLCSNLESIT
jgi:hypothetical protein